MTADKDATGRTFDQLRVKYGELKSERDRLAGTLETLEGDLAELKSTLQREHGSDDLKVLQEQLLKQQADNDAKTAEYGAHLAELQGQLEDLERAVEGGGDEAEEGGS